MHNVKKTSASEAYRVSEEKRRAAKANSYVEVRDRVFDKRKKGKWSVSALVLLSLHSFDLQVN